MIVYGDLLFLINFSMDFLCFYLSCLILHKKMNTFRVVLASSLGGIYSVISLFLSVNGILAFTIDIIVLISMCCVGYGVKSSNFASLVKAIFLYFFVSALLGGLMTALFSLFNSMDVLSEIENSTEGIDVWIFALLTVGGTIIALRGGRIFRGSFSKKKVMLEMKNEKGCVELCALVDSGNLATEPISGKSVAFVNIEKCKKLIDEPLYNSIINSSYIDDANLSTKYKIRIVPTQAISGRTFLPAVKFSRVAIVDRKTKKDIDIYIAFVSGELLSEYDAIISHETII